MRFVVCAVLVVCLAVPGVCARTPNPVAGQAQEDQYFSGVVTKVEEGKITVTRTVLGKEDATKTFLVTRETRTEGKPKLKARVTVRYLSEEGADRAVHILVRK